MRIWLKSFIIFIALFLIGFLVFGVFLKDTTGFWISTGVEGLFFIVGVLVGRALELQKIRDKLVTEIDKAVNDLSRMRRLNLRDHSKLYFESQNMERFCQKFFRILTEEFDYDLGFLEITDPSLPYPFLNSFPRKAPLPPQTVLEAIKKIVLRSEGRIISCGESEMAKRFLDYGVDLIGINLPCKRVVIVPIAHDEKEILGYFALFSSKGVSLIRRLMPFIYPESELLAEIENKKIDDSIKFFIERQRLLLAIGLVRILDTEVFEQILTKNINGFAECAHKIVEIITQQLKLPVGFIYLKEDLLPKEDLFKNPEIYVRDETEISHKRIKDEFILLFIDEVKHNWPKDLVVDNIARYVSPVPLKLEHFLACPISTSSRDYGIIGFIKREPFNDFDQELILNIENFKIDDCFSTLDRLMNNTL
jgi:hypothetical protein